MPDHAGEMGRAGHILAGSGASGSFSGQAQIVIYIPIRCIKQRMPLRFTLHSAAFLHSTDAADDDAGKYGILITIWRLQLRYLEQVLHYWRKAFDGTIFHQCLILKPDEQAVSSEYFEEELSGAILQAFTRALLYHQWLLIQKNRALGRPFILNTEIGLLVHLKAQCFA